MKEKLRKEETTVFIGVSIALLEIIDVLAAAGPVGKVEGVVSSPADQEVVPRAGLQDVVAAAAGAGLAFPSQSLYVETFPGQGPQSASPVAQKDA